MARWVIVLVLGACSNSVSLADYPDAFRDAYCNYLARCGAFPDVDTCKKANIGFNLHIDPSSQAAVDQGKVIFDGDTAAKCLDEFGSQTCDQTDASGRSLPTSCGNIVHGTVGAGGQCALDEECKSGTCDVPTCQMACCQGTCTGDAPPAPGGAGTACTGSSQCTSGNFCDFSATPTVCAPLKAAGATCQSTSECAYGLGCAGTTTRTCKTLPKLGEACPDGVCRDAGDYCSTTDMTCKKIGLAGATCTSSNECSSFYPCDTTTMKCTKGPGTGQPCGTSLRCFDAGTFCDTSATTPTCVTLRADGGACTASSQCESDNCDMTGSAGMCSEGTVCI
jgi:hypothetical protein